VTGAISKTQAIIFGSVLLLLGLMLLYFHTNALTAVVALVGFIVYVFPYTLLKRRTVFGTIIGAVAGAVPPVVGYTAVANHLDTGAWILFAILMTWQMPHFYSIAIY